MKVDARGMAEACSRTCTSILLVFQSLMFHGDSISDVVHFLYLSCKI